MRFNPKSLLNLDQTTHGMYGTPTYKSWQAMWQRCKSKEKAKWYAGLTVCERWRDFSNFYADMGERPAGKTLDRIDNAKGYTPDNCRWATPSEQQSNKRSNRLIEFNGKRQCMKHWAAELGLQVPTLRKRLLAGWPIDRALSPRMFHESKGKRKSANA